MLSSPFVQHHFKCTQNGQRRHPRPKNRLAMTHDFATKKAHFDSAFIYLRLCVATCSCGAYDANACAVMHLMQLKPPCCRLRWLAAVLFLGRLTIPYCPLPVDAALLTGQHGLYRVTSSKWRNRGNYEHEDVQEYLRAKNADGWAFFIWCTFLVEIGTICNFLFFCFWCILCH